MIRLLNCLVRRTLYENHRLLTLGRPSSKVFISQPTLAGASTLPGYPHSRCLSSLWKCDAIAQKVTPPLWPIFVSDRLNLPHAYPAFSVILLPRAL